MRTRIPQLFSLGISRRTRWLAYVLLAMLAFTQVLLLRTIQSVHHRHHDDQPMMMIIPQQSGGGAPSHNTPLVAGRLSSNLRLRPVDEPPKSDGPRATPAVVADSGQMTAESIPKQEQQQSKIHNLPSGGTMPVALTLTDMNNLSSLPDNESFCIPWEVSSDTWWTHHVEWVVFHEDDSHYCFRRMKDPTRVAAMRAIYENQFQNDCSDPIYKKMWNSGLTNDFRNLVDGLMYSTRTMHQPFQVTTEPWHYASPKPFNITTAACPSQDMFCYFLPLSKCPRKELNDTIRKIPFFDRGSVLGPVLFDEPARWYLDYVGRQQTWLRHRVYQFVQKQKVVAPCTALHVRRGDVISHGTHSRRYFAIADYLSTSKKIEHNIFLLTDDHNAIGEALHEFPDRNWMYIDRPRYSGNEGGFERHLPSNDPILEITVLLATFRLVRQCTSMVRGSSAFGDWVSQAWSCLILVCWASAAVSRLPLY